MKRFNLFAILALLFLSVGACAQTTPKSTTAASGLTPKGTEVVQLDKESFKKLVFDFETLKEWKYSGSMPAILDFYADWCGPCRMLAPHLEELQAKYKGKLQVYKINTDKQKELAAAFGISSLPTIVFVPMTGQPQAAMGYRPLADLEAEVKNVLKVSN